MHIPWRAPYAAWGLMCQWVWLSDMVTVQVVCCTLTGALGRHLQGEAGKFDVVFIDEAAQVLAAPRGNWLALSHSPVRRLFRNKCNGLPTHRKFCLAPAIRIACLATQPPTTEH